MGVDRNGSRVGIVAGHDIGSAVAQQRKPFRDGRGVPARFDHHIGAAPVGELHDRVAATACFIVVEGQHHVGPHSTGELEPHSRCTDGHHESCSSQRGERGCGQAHRSRPLDDDGVAHGERAALDGGKSREQPAPSPDDVVHAQAMGKLDDADAGLEVDPLGPTA